MATKKTIEESIYDHIEGIHRLCDRSGQNLSLLRPFVIHHYHNANYFIKILMRKNPEKARKYTEDLKELPNQFQEYKSLFPKYSEN